MKLLTKALLCVPAHQERKARHALKRPQVIWDLEDACPPEAKAQGLEIVRRFARPEDFVRIERDAEGPVWDLPVQAFLIGKWDLTWPGSGRKTPVIPIIETPRGFLDLRDAIVQGWGGRVVGLAYGPQDFTAACGLPGEFKHPIVDRLADETFIAARALGVPCIAPPSFRLDIPEVRQDVQDTWERGFDCSWSLHPDHCAMIEEIYARPRRSRAWLEAVLAKPGDGFRVAAGGVVNPATVRACRKGS